MLRPRRYEQNKLNMALMQIKAKPNHKHSKTWMQHDMMKLHAKPRKFHVDHTPNGATVQHIHSKQDIITICPKQQPSTLQSSKQHSTGTK